jgi:hypothetical protein
MKRIAAITMVRGDAFYLRKWTAWYGSQLGEENLYILLDGRDQPLPDWCPKAHVIPCDRVGGGVARADKGRINLISDEAARLFADGYDLVIGTDADEMLAVDPRLGVGLAEFLSGLDVRTAVSALGLDMGQRLGEEGDIVEDRPSWNSGSMPAWIRATPRPPCWAVRSAGAAAFIAWKVVIFILSKTYTCSISAIST